MSTCPSISVVGHMSSLISQLSADDYSSMSRLLPPLETLSQQHPDVVVQELASSLRAVIATHGAYCPENLTAAASRNDPETPAQTEADHSQTPVNVHRRVPPSSGGSGVSPRPHTKPFSDWLLEACDPDVPTKAFALRVLTQMVQHGDPEAVQAQEKVLTVSPGPAVKHVSWDMFNK